VKVIQLTGLVARHEHSRATVTTRVPLPPPGPYEVADDETEASHRVEVGEVTLVDVLAELPHAIVPTAITNSRGTRELTARLMHKPRHLGCAGDWRTEGRVVS
jgi:hypothetical protein